ncbi:MAG: hypothetical protein IJJ41_05560 [Clostridia bacterium]|nr:hypothetical protein [Clostridia bacterium]
MREWYQLFLHEWQIKKAKGLSYPKAWLLPDCALEQLFYGVSPVEYFTYEFYRKGLKKRRAYAAGRKIWRLYDALNPDEYAHFLNNKADFCKKYTAYIHRDTLFSERADLEQFKAFIRKHPRFFAKPYHRSGGIGADIMECGEDEAPELFETLQKKHYQIEEIVKQCEELAAFNASSVNTLRFLTFVNAQGGVEILSLAGMRFGREGMIADNVTSHHGIGCNVDARRGCVCTQGMDSEGNLYSIHPDSGLPIVNFAIPEWEKIRAALEEIALVEPHLRLVGWDIAVNAAREVVFIEGNRRPDPIAFQCYGVGYWDVFKGLKTRHKEKK